jgi:hypothetical protein
MSGEGSFGVSLWEKIFGLLIFVVGCLASYFTLTSVDTLKNFTWFFGAISLILIVLGLLLITSKTE